MLGKSCLACWAKHDLAQHNKASKMVCHTTSKGDPFQRISIRSFHGITRSLYRGGPLYLVQIAAIAMAVAILSVSNSKQKASQNEINQTNIKSGMNNTATAIKSAVKSRVYGSV